MRHILLRRDIVADPWRYPGEECAEGDPVIVPLAALRIERERWWSWTGRLGARLGPADRVADLAADLPRLDLVAIEFPNAGDGRGYSQAGLLRRRLRFRGELRAVGSGVRQDQAFFLARCGFDSLEPPQGVDLEAVRRALSRYDVAYQPAAPVVELLAEEPLVQLRRQRFSARAAALPATAPLAAMPPGAVPPAAALEGPSADR
jgi:uncharacterized protein (DUF934 family)